MSATRNTDHKPITDQVQADADTVYRLLPGTDLRLFPLCLGGNVFGFTADEHSSFAVLDAYLEAGGNIIDTADSYCAWLGTEGGESETIIGRWLKSRKVRDQVLLATKVGQAPGRTDLRSGTIRSALEGSLQRLGVDHVDLYYAHEDHGDPLFETLAAFDDLVRQGKARYVAASNYSADRLIEALDLASASGLSPYLALQPLYNLMDRAAYEQDLAPVANARGFGVLPYWGLACGYLTGKYRTDGPEVEGPRTPMVEQYVNPRGEAVLAGLREIAAGHACRPAAVALAWLASRPSVVAPIASARTPQQLRDLLPMAGIRLTERELTQLDMASAPKLAGPLR